MNPPGRATVARKLAVFRSGLLFGFGLGTVIGFLLATGLAALALSNTLEP